MRSHILDAVNKMLQAVIGQGQESILRINTDGCPMTRGTGDGVSTLYCGRTLGVDAIPGSVGRCGPNNGPQCRSCEMAQKYRTEVSFPSCSTKAREDRLRDSSDALKAMIIGNSDINSKNIDDDSAMLIAASKGDENLLLTLVAAKADINVDKNGKSALEITEDEKCQNILKWMGADGWTPLMVAAENKPSKVGEYLKLREVLLSIKNRQPFPNWFEAFVQNYESLVDADWTWGPCEPSSMSMSPNKLNIRKTNGSPDYSGAVGSEPFDAGVHSWAVQVDNVTAMWLGIARCIEDGLDSNPGEHGEYVLAFSCTEGDLRMRGQDATLEFPEESGSESEEDSEECTGQSGSENEEDAETGSDNEEGSERSKTDSKDNSESSKKDSESSKNSSSFPGYSSGQIIQFELNCNEHSLQVSIDGKLVVTAHNVDDKDVRPYLCMDYFESATLLVRSKQAPSGAAPSIQEHNLAFDNSLWSTEEDSALTKLQIKGSESGRFKC